MAKETLSVDLDPMLIERVRRYSEEHGTDLSETIEQLIETLPTRGSERSLSASGQGEAEDWISELTPGVRKLLGAGAGDVNEEDYHQYLLDKYGR